MIKYLIVLCSCLAINSLETGTNLDVTISPPDKVLIVFAHPDDETWMNGTVAKFADQGINLHLIYSTSGDAGDDVSGRNLQNQTLATEREQETRAALKSLGVQNTIEFLRFHDGELQANIFPLAQKILVRMQAFKPQLVITFGPGGVTGHPDHIAAGLATQLAFDQAGGPIQLHNIAVSTARVAVLSQAADKYAVGQYQPVEQVHPQATLKVDVSAQAEARTISLHHHKTQFPEAILNTWADFVAVSNYEEFIVSRHRDR